MLRPPLGPRAGRHQTPGFCPGPAPRAHWPRSAPGYLPARILPIVGISSGHTLPLPRCAAAAFLPVCTGGLSAGPFGHSRARPPRFAPLSLPAYLKYSFSPVPSEDIASPPPRLPFSLASFRILCGSRAVSPGFGAVPRPQCPAPAQFPAGFCRPRPSSCPAPAVFPPFPAGFAALSSQPLPPSFRFSQCLFSTKKAPVSFAKPKALQKYRGTPARIFSFARGKNHV